MNEHRNAVKALATQFGLETHPHIRLLDLSAKLGELSKEYLTLRHYGRKDFEASDAWELELGDVCFSLLCLANVTGVSLEQALQNVIQKYQTRFDNKGTIGSS